MGCNGNNHAKDCSCAFRGGRSNASAPKWNGWTKTSFKKYRSGTNALCPKCGTPVFFIRFSHGRGTFFDRLDPSRKRHPCTDSRLRYSPFNKAGTPKLRNRRSAFERDGWSPFFIKNIETSISGTLISGEALVGQGHFLFGFLDQFSPDLEAPVFFRIRTGREPRVELNFFPKGSDTSHSLMGFEDCGTELELAAKRGGTLKAPAEF